MKSFVSIYRVRCTKSFLSQLPANIFIFNLNLMVSDNRENSLISVQLNLHWTIFRTVSSLIAYVGRVKTNEGCWGGGGGGRGGWEVGGGVGVHVHHVHHVHMFISLRRQGNNQRGVLGWGAGVVCGGGGARVVGGWPPWREQKCQCRFFLKCQCRFLTIYSYTTV